VFARLVPQRFNKAITQGQVLRAEPVQHCWDWCQAGT